MNNSEILNKGCSVYAFEIDDVLFAKRDYVLQVFYLFANFLDYTEGTDRAATLVEFMKSKYELNGNGDELAVVIETLKHFAIPESYVENFERLRANAHLPLKLYLTSQAKALFEEIISRNKKIAVLTDGNPVEQLNKLKHIDWEEFDFYLPSLKVYFIQELKFRDIDPIEYIGQEYSVVPKEVHFISHFSKSN